MGLGARILLEINSASVRSTNSYEYGRCAQKLLYAAESYGGKGNFDSIVSNNSVLLDIFA